MQHAASRISIIVFILIYSLNGHPINSALIFSLLLFYNSMGLHKLMIKANNLEDINISLGKIEEYLINEERDSSYINRSLSSEAEIAIAVRGGSFYWQKEGHHNEIIEEIGFSLKDINFQVKKGEFIALVG